MNIDDFNSARKSRIDRNVAKRQSLKKKWDRHCKYGAEDQDLVAGVNAMFSHEKEVNFGSRGEENWVRMLDEGVVVDGDGYCYAVIKKGVLKEFFENLPSNFEGYIDKDHIYAIRLGNYTKEDMRLVETGDGRYGVDINVKLDDDYYATRDLLKQGEHRAVSVEMAIDFDEFGLADKITGDKSQGKYLVPIINKVNILGYAVCENPKNANSIKDDLLDKASVEGDNMKDEELKKLAAEDEQEAQKAEEESTQTTEDTPEEDTAEDNAVENTEEVDVSAEEDVEAEGDEAETEAKEAEEKESETPEADAEVKEGLEQLGAAIKELREQMAAKDEKIAELENQLAAKAEKAQMSASEQIAKLLNLATGAEPTAAEGSKVETPSNDLADKYAADDAEWDEAAKAMNY